MIRNGVQASEDFYNNRNPINDSEVSRYTNKPYEGEGKLTF